MQKIALTTGDLDGIGLEIALRSLLAVQIKSHQQVFLFCGEKSATLAKRRLGLKKHYFSLDAALADSVSDKNRIFIVASTKAPAFWVQEAAENCMDQKLEALVTGPLSKPEIKRAGLNDLGHTDILKRVSKTNDLYMSFWGEKFNVVLLTDHIPLSLVPSQITKARILKAASLTLAACEIFNPKKKSLPIAFLGLNPHAGDEGLIGLEERKWKGFKDNQGVFKSLLGPLPADSAFTKENWPKFSAYLAAYHDQGLIPFKSVHGFSSGVHVTLGLPFLRTSVDHGPAKDKVGSRKINEGSMKAALKMALNKGPK